MNKYILLLLTLLIMINSGFSEEMPFAGVTLKDDVLSYTPGKDRSIEFHFNRVGTTLQKEPGKFLGLQSIIDPHGGNIETVLSLARQLEVDGLEIQVLWESVDGEVVPNTWNRKENYTKISSLSHLKDLRIYIVYDVKYDDIMPLSALGSLRYLLLLADSLSGTISSDFFKGMSCLETLSLTFDNEYTLPDDCLSGNGKLTSLYLISSEGTVTSFGALSPLTNLKQLTITCKDSDIEALISALPTGIEDLTIYCRASTQADISLQLGLLSRLPKLNSLSVLRADPCSDTPILRSLLPELPVTLTRLTLTITGCNGALLRQIGNLANLQYLQFDGLMNIDEGFAYLAELRALNALSITGNEPSDNLIRLINSLHLDTIDMECYNEAWTNSDVAMFAGVSHLKALDLKGTFADDALDPLEFVPSLEFLSINVILKDEMIEERPFGVLKWIFNSLHLDAISKCKELLELEITSNYYCPLNISGAFDESWKRLFECKKLNSLRIDSSIISADAIKYIKQLKYLWISTDSFDPYITPLIFRQLNNYDFCNVLPSYIALFSWSDTNCSAVKWNSVITDAGNQHRVYIFWHEQDDYSLFAAYIDEEQRRFAVTLPDKSLVERLSKLTVNDVDFSKDGEEPRIKGGFKFIGTGDVPLYW